MFTLDNLTKLNQVPLDMTLEGLKAVGQGQQADTIGLQELMREQQFNQQADPFRIQKLSNDVNIGLQDLQQKTRDNREGEYTSYARMQDNLQKHLAAASSADVTMAYNKFRLMAADPDPKKRALGIAGLQTTEEFLKELEHTRRSESVARIGVQGQLDLADKNNAAGRYAKVDRSSLLIALRNSKSAAQTAEILSNAALAAAQAGDRQEAEELMLRAQQARERAAEDARNRGADPNKLNIPQASGMPAAQGPTAVAPVGPSGNAQAKAQHSLQELRGMYPGKSDAELKQVYKAKFGVEPQ